MTKPFRPKDDYIVIIKGKKYRFPTSTEADEFYYEMLEEQELKMNYQQEVAYVEG